MASKLPAENIQDSATNPEEQKQKDFLDPATTATIGAAAWFAIKAALQGVIGYIAVKLFEPIWNWRGSKEKDEPTTGIPAKEQEPES